MDGVGGIEFSDLDNDGTPEAIVPANTSCRTYPTITEIYRWNGSTFADATGQFPTYLEQADAQVRTSLASAQNRGDVLRRAGTLTIERWLSAQASLQHRGC